jgi:alpha-N-acetylglucosaminidase
MLVLDLQSEQHPQYNKTSSFYGQKFIFCHLHNFGGTLGMHGSIRLVNEEIPRAAFMDNSSMVGVGITPEGISQNYVVYEFVLDKAWAYQEINHRKWIKNYAKCRYGIDSSAIKHAWVLLLKSVYAFEGTENIRGKYVYCRRPSLRLKPFKWYDEKYVRKALEKFITIATNESYPINNLFKRDLVDLTRQFLQLQAESIYLKLVDSFRIKKNRHQFSHISDMFIDLLRDLDVLLGTHEDFLLGRFLDGAKSMATNAHERVQYEFNARNQITLWGNTGQIVDYATKQWNGIVIDYYLPRWLLFIYQLKISLETNVPFNQSKFQQDVLHQVELPFNEDNKIYPTVANGIYFIESHFM